MKPHHLIPLLLLLFSCKNEREEQLKRDIVGEWKFVSAQKDSGCLNVDEPPALPGRNMLGYGFYKDGLCEYKPGFQIMFTLNGKPAVGYEGKKCSYVISADSLKIMRNSGKVFQAYKIEYLKGDTLLLRSNSFTGIKMERMHYTIDPSEHYTSIEVVSTLGRVKIDDEGNVLYKTNRITGREGYLKGNISRKRYRELERDFLKANITSLDMLYYSTASDGAIAVVSFLKDGKIIKRIEDYGLSSPPEFQWAYRSLIYLFVDKNLKPYATKYPEIAEWNVHVVKEQKELCLSWIDEYKLITAFDKAVQTEQHFSPVYNVFYGFPKPKQKCIQTDGRYYKFPPEAGGKTLDLGYNFIERNNLEKRFEKK